MMRTPRLWNVSTRERSPSSIVASWNPATRPSRLLSFACRTSATVRTATKASGCAATSRSRKASARTVPSYAAAPVVAKALTVTFTAVIPDARAFATIAGVHAAANMFGTLNGPGVARQSMTIARS
jgi:hypothetical protein